MKLLLAAALVALIGALPAAPLPEFTDWSEPVNLGPDINTRYLDSCVAISKNGRSLFFSSNRQSPGTTNRDLYVSQRESVDAPWGPPQALTVLNTAAWESCPALSLDEHRLYFTSPRAVPGACGGQDIWVSRRQDRRDDLWGWEPPVNLGCAPAGPNSPANDLVPTLFEDEDGRVLMYFGSTRSGNQDHYQTVMADDDTFGPATPIAELNGPYGDTGITVRRDGLEVIFLSNRPGGGGSGAVGLFDFWRATRASTADPWPPPAFVEGLGSPAWAQGKIALSFDGRELYFTSYRQPSTGGVDLPDIWVARREKVGGSR
jgi:WD40-like Beta Propeller Repeat